MMRRFISAWIAACITFFPFSADAVLKGVAAAPGLQNAASVAITGGTITGTNVPYRLSGAAIPFIKLSSGSMGNNGAVTGLTALPVTYSGGAWAWVPAGAVAAGVPAAASWLWFVGSSATAGTVYNSTYTSGTPTMGTQTAFATTGPGAFTGDTGEVAAVSITVPASALTVNGKLRAYLQTEMTNSAGAKTFRARWSGAAGTVLFSPAFTTQLEYAGFFITSNRGVTNSQTTNAAGAGSGLGATTGTPTLSTIDTTASTTYVFTLQTAAAADNAILEDYLLEVFP